MMKPAAVAIEREHIVAMLDRLLGPDVETASTNGSASSPWLNVVSMNGRSSGSVCRWKICSSTLMCGALQRVLQLLGHAVRRFLAQLTQHDGRRAARDRTAIGTGSRTGSRPESPTAIASRAASRRLRSRSSWPTADGPTPRPDAAREPELSSDPSAYTAYSDLSRDFGSPMRVEKRAVRGQRRMPRHQRLRDLVRLEQQILALVGGAAFAQRHRSRSAPAASPLANRAIARRQPCRRFFSRIAPPPLFVRGQRLAVTGRRETACVRDCSGRKRRPARASMTRAQRRLRFVEPPQLAADDADVVQNREAARIVRERLAERGERRVGPSSSPSVAPRLLKAAEKVGIRSPARWNASRAPFAMSSQTSQSLPLSYGTASQSGASAAARSSAARAPAHVARFAAGARQRELRRLQRLARRAAASRHSADALGRCAGVGERRSSALIATSTEDTKDTEEDLILPLCPLCPLCPPW